MLRQAAAKQASQVSQPASQPALASGLWGQLPSTLLLLHTASWPIIAHNCCCESSDRSGYAAIVLCKRHESKPYTATDRCPRSLPLPLPLLMLLLLLLLMLMLLLLLLLLLLVFALPTRPRPPASLAPSQCIARGGSSSSTCTVVLSEAEKGHGRDATLGCATGNSSATHCTTARGLHRTIQAVRREAGASVHTFVSCPVPRPARCC